MPCAAVDGDQMVSLHGLWTYHPKPLIKAFDHLELGRVPQGSRVVAGLLFNLQLFVGFGQGESSSSSLLPPSPHWSGLANSLPRLVALTDGLGRRGAAGLSRREGPTEVDM